MAPKPPTSLFKGRQKTPGNLFGWPTTQQLLLAFRQLT